MFNLQAIEVKAVIAGIIFLLILILGYGNYYFHQKYVGALITNGELKTQNDSYLSTIKSDSDTVAKLAADSKAREEAAAKALSDAQQKARAYQIRAQELLAASASNPDNLCLSADALFNQYLQGK